MRFNPFRPGSIVPPGMFCGRIEEIMALERILFQTSKGNPNHFLLQGERGIGKSSLLYYMQCVATGQILALDGQKFKFIKVNLELTPANSYVDIIKKLGTELQREVASYSGAKELLKTAWSFLKNWEVAGVRYNTPATSLNPEELLDDLTHTISKTLEEFGGEISGIIVLIDEADKPNESARLGELLKILTERLTKKGADRICFGLSGLPDVVRKLKSSHESSPRIFEIFTLQCLSLEERKEVVRSGLRRAEKENGFAVTITPEAENWIGWWSEGFPHFVQQFAHSAFDTDIDNNIDENDVDKGAFKENGAFQQLGVKYFEEMYFDKINSDEYREVLKAMSQIDIEIKGSWISRQQIRDKLDKNEIKMKPTTFNNAVRTLLQRKIIVPKPGSKGQYRFPTTSFGVWIRGYSQAKIQSAALK
ncbi:MAG: ATP-binding protein [Candidatus Omnitrophota bacterium]|nr:ATP-binding protein [Candidatus Omnitrophota bacterium]